jgi:hypothetical protein
MLNKKIPELLRIHLPKLFGKWPKGFSIMFVRWHKGAKYGFSTPFPHSGDVELEAFPIFQTVSPGTSVNRVSRSPCGYTDAVAWRPAKEGAPP